MSNDVNEIKSSILIKVMVWLTLLVFIVDFLSDLLRGQPWQGYRPSMVAFSFSLTLLAISIITHYFSNSFFALMNDMSVKISSLPSSIKTDTSDVINRLKSDIDEFKKKLSSGIVEHERLTYRALIYHEDKGEILNGFSGEAQTSRNILLSNKTINLIFRGIKALGEDALRNIGRQSSERFASEFVEDIRKKNRESGQKGQKQILDLHDWILAWITFDSDAGFGKFHIASDKENWKKDKSIILSYSFLTEDHRADEESICEFMAGYIEGILNAFPRNVLEHYGLKSGRVRIVHDSADPNQCVWAGREPQDGCIYNITCP